MRNIVNKTKSSKKRFGALFKGIPIPTYSWQKIDDNLFLIDYNDAAEKITKGMIKNYVGSKASEMYKSEPEILEDLFRCANDHVNIFREVKYGFMSTGVERFLSVMYGFIPPDLVIVHTEDITERKEVLERLKKSEKELQSLNLKLKQKIEISEEKYRIIFENTGTATLIIEEDTTISLVNGPFEELSGYSREEIEWKKNWSEFVIKEDLERMDKLYNLWRKDPVSTLKKYEFRFVNKKGDIRDILLVIDKIPESKKSVASLLDISERKKTEEIIKKETEKSNNYLNIAGVVIVALDTEGNITLLNKKGHKILQYNEGELIGKNWFKTCLPKRYRQNTHEIFTKLIQGQLELVEFYENPILTKNGDEKIIAWHNSILYNNNGEIFGVLTSGEDITERKKTEQKLKDSEKKYRELFENAPDGISIIDSKGYIVDCNKADQKLMGYDYKEMVGKHITTFFSDDSKPLFKQNFTILKKIGTVEEELILVRKDGGIIPISRTVSTIYDDNGNFFGGIVHSRNITARKKVEERMRLLSSAVEQSNEGIAVIDLKEKVIFANNAFSDMHGYTSNELIGNHVSILHTPDQMPSVEAANQQILEWGDFNGEIWHVRKDGSVFPSLMHNSLFRDDMDNPIGIIGTLIDITERKKVELKLKESEEKYRYLFDNAQVGLYWSRISDGKFLECNDTFAKLFGYDTREECLADYNAIEHYIDPNARSKMLEKLRDKKEVKNYELHVTRRDGTPIWLSVSVRLVEKETFIEGAAIDITERKKAEQKLKENTEFTQNIFNAIQDGLSVLDLDLNIVKVNPYMIERYGSFDQIVNKKCYDVYQKRSSPCPWCPSIKTIETGQLNSSIVPYPTTENPTGWLELTSFPLKNSDGIIEGIIEYVKDITDRKKAENKLQLERDNFLNILNSIEDGVYIVDQNFNIEYANPILIEEFGLFEGIKCFKYFQDRNEICPWCKNEDLFQGKTVRLECYSPINQKTYDLIGTPLKNPDGSISILEIFRDVSESKKVEKELKESEEKYREAYNRAEFYKDLFAHDINNILQSILSGTQISQLILDRHEKLDDLKLNAEIIKEQVIRGSRLVSNVRKLSKLEEAGRSLEKIEILNVLKNTVSLVKKSYKKDNNLVILVDSIGEKFFIKANNLLEDVFENLLINAIRHNKNSIVEITVRISRERKVGMSFLKLEFLDNGFGVADSMKEKVFQRGYSKEKGVYGMGLGLSLVRRIIETYNGKIWVEDKVKGGRSKGSNFVLLIPEVD